MPKNRFWEVKLVLYLNESAKSIFTTTFRLYGPTKAKKRAKKGPKGGPKYKIAYYEAKWDFKVPKVLSCVVKLVCYLNESARSIFSTTVRLYGPTEAKKEQKIGPKGGPKPIWLHNRGFCVLNPIEPICCYFLALVGH